MTRVASRMATPIITPWVPGPVREATGPVVVSVTSLTSDRHWDLPGIAVTGLRLRLGWYAMPGAVGVWLWTLPGAARTGSISVWTSTEDLRRFVGLPLHLDVMRRYRGRGTVLSTTWTEPTLDRADVLARARRWIADPG